MSRFDFGENWANFLSTLNDCRIAEAEKSLVEMVGANLRGKRFLDIGSGSGLMSLVARRLGARVHSFDYNPESVRCTEMLRDRYFPSDADWTVESGDALDANYLSSLGQYDIVYAWGVLHHTGDMWKALANVDKLVANGGTLFVAIYNDQGRMSRFWLVIKRLYNSVPGPVQKLMAALTVVRFWTRSVVTDLVRYADPLRPWRDYQKNRGMSPWHDAVDWVGGYPFEVAKPDQIFDFYRERGYVLDRMTTCAGSIGCNQYVFRREGMKD